MDLRSRLAIQTAGYFFLILLPTFLVLGFFLANRTLNQYVLIAAIGLAVFGTFMVIQTVDTMRGLPDDEKTRQWLEAASRKDAASADAEDRDAEKEKLLAELRGSKDARLPRASAKPAHWRALDDAALKSQVVRLLKMLGRRVQRSGDSVYRGFDLVIDNIAVVQCGAGPKKGATVAARDLLTTVRAHPACTAAILVWPKGIPARARYLARSTKLILWDADNISRVVKNNKLA
jgi:hypothetical protein